MLQEQGFCEFRKEVFNAQGGDLMGVLCQRTMGITSSQCINPLAEQSACKLSSLPVEEIPRTSPNLLIRNLRRQRMIDPSFFPEREEVLREF